MVNRSEYRGFWIRFALAMPLATIGLLLCITIIGAPLGLLIIALIGRWLGKIWKELDDRKQAAFRSAIVKQELDETIAVPEEELPWLI
jgi:hypothetical protein